jgi:hypothetical protein
MSGVIRMGTWAAHSPWDLCWKTISHAAGGDACRWMPKDARCSKDLRDEAVRGAEIARKAGLESLAYLLDCAAIEAEDQLKNMAPESP